MLGDRNDPMGVSTQCGGGRGERKHKSCLGNQERGILMSSKECIVTGKRERGQEKGVLSKGVVGIERKASLGL